MPSDDRVIVALDLPRTEAVALATALRGRVAWLKVGMTLFYAEGPRIVSELTDQGFEVFLDLKLNDIPHQVGGAAAAIARLGVGMFTVHASGGLTMMRAAVESSRRAAEEAGHPAPAVLAVTVLTSTGESGLNEVGIPASPAEQVARLARLACEAGVDGLVCSPNEAAAMQNHRRRGPLGRHARRPAVVGRDRGPGPDSDATRSTRGRRESPGDRPPDNGGRRPDRSCGPDTQ